MAKELYERLGLTESATDSQIAESYKALSAQTTDNKRLDSLKEAYDVLSDIERRANYDIRGQKASGIRRRNGKVDKQVSGVIKARTLLNRIFLCGAAISAIFFVLYLTGMAPTAFYIVCGASLVIKIAEYILRLVQ